MKKISNKNNEEVEKEEKVYKTDKVFFIFIIKLFYFIFRFSMKRKGLEDFNCLINKKNYVQERLP